MLQNYVRIQNVIAKLRDSERGATAVEYGLIVALIAAIIVAVVAAVGTSVKEGFDTVNNAL
ncbi:MAG: Flp family type IVb pilin [Acidimicrobiia bacterium]|nr:Flp family type IVb pilin [Acidimicrobiia bacterium]